MKKSGEKCVSSWTNYKNKIMTTAKPKLGEAGKLIRDFVIITLGVALYAFSWTGVIMPADGVGGGATGFSLLVYYMTGGANGGIPIGVTFIIFNAIFLGICMVLLGAKFGIKTIYAIVVTSIMMTIFQELLPPEANVLGLADDRLLSSILGGALSGIGIATCLLVGGSTGGSDLIAMIVCKFYNVSYSQVVVVVDIFIIGSSYFIFDDWATTIYGFIVTAVFGYTSDLVLSGNKQSLQLFVFSKDYAKIADMITMQLGRGATILDGTGWYSKQPVKVVMLICRRSEMGMMMRSIKSVDPKAFISVANVMGVYGEGFEKYKMPKKPAEIKPVKHDNSESLV